MKKLFIIVFFIFFNITAINLHANGIPLSTVSDTNTYHYMKGRQMINVNFSTGYAGFLTGFLNAITYDYEITTNFAKLNFNLLIPGISKFLHNMDFKGSMWYIPNVAYTYLHKQNLGFEFSMGVQSMSFKLVAPQSKISGILDEGTEARNIYGDSTFESSYTYIPMTFGVKLFTGKTRRTVNTFRIGLEPVVYTLKTKNTIDGITTTSKTYRNFNMYISYELGWSIELFPTREWAVKPYFDISLFELGYYVKSSAHILYRDTLEHFKAFGKGTSLLDFLDMYIPTLQSAPYLPYVMGIRFIFLPRIGFSMRF